MPNPACNRLFVLHASSLFLTNNKPVGQLEEKCEAKIANLSSQLKKTKFKWQIAKYSMALVAIAGIVLINLFEVTLSLAFLSEGLKAPPLALAVFVGVVFFGLILVATYKSAKLETSISSLQKSEGAANKPPLPANLLLPVDSGLAAAPAPSTNGRGQMERRPSGELER